MKKIETKLLDFDDYSLEEAIEWVKDSSTSERFRYVVTPNIDHLIRLVDNRSELDYLYKEADLCVCDSRILHKIMRYKKYPLKSVVPGSDLTERLLNDKHLLGKEILIFGSDDRVFSIMQSKYSELQLCHINPSMGFINKPDELTQLTERIVEISPHVIFLAVGSPQQEKFANHLQKHLQAGVALCIGASILFLAGEEKRAPKIFQILHLEWLFRMVVAPRLIKRYWGNFLSLSKLYRTI